MNFNSLSKWVLIVRYLGLGWVVFRLGYAFKMRTGYFVRKGPVSRWTDVEGEGDDVVLITPSENPRPGTILADAERIVGGEMCLFFKHWVTVGESPDWHRNPITGEVAPRGKHWSCLGDFSFGDIKNIWEPSRFGWAFTLAQAYHLSGKAVFAERFWQLLESWMDGNPPNEGVNWKCGQECALRLMAVCYAGDVLYGSESSTDERRKRTRQLAAATADRIELNLSYALSQKNNHGISECVGLVTAAQMLPGHPRSVRWLIVGLKNLKNQLDELLYPDGGFSQHSVNYHRVVLDNLVWATKVLDSSGAPIPEWLRAAGERATRWLALLTDETSGATPCLGSNDGAWILPLANGGYTDYRPTVQCGGKLFCGVQVNADESCDDQAAWLGVGESEVTSDAASPLAPEGLTLLANSGLGVIRSGEILCVLRSMPKFRHRMGHVDMLHVSLIVAGQPIILDGGSYSYNTQGKRADAQPLSSACYHNGPRLSGVEPVKKVSRFLALPWPKGSLKQAGAHELVGSHDGYWSHGHLMRRMVSLNNDTLTIADITSGPAGADVEWYWLFPDVPYTFDTSRQRLMLDVKSHRIEFSWEMPNGSARVVRSDEHSFEGWSAPYYQGIVPAIGLGIKGHAPAAFRVRVEKR